MNRVRRLAAFCYEFVVGEDWQLAAAVVLALAAGTVLSRHASGTWWWIVPAAAVVVLPLSLWRAIRRTAAHEGPDPTSAIGHDAGPGTDQQ